MPDGSNLATPVPDDAIWLPSDESRLASKAMQLVDQCRSTVSQRAAYCRVLAAFMETGRQDGSKSLINLMYNHVDRLASYLYSPVSLRFGVEYDFDYPSEYQARAKVAAKILTRDWSNTSTDMMFGQGVFESLKYGATLLKQWPERDGDGFSHNRSLVMPWNFGVYAEYLNDLDRQPVMCETITLTLPEVWQRIYMMKNARDLYDKIRSHAQAGGTADGSESFFHSVLSTSTLQTGMTQSGGRAAPGGIVQLNVDPNFAMMAPQSEAQLARLHELYVWDGDGRTTIQIIEPDILIHPTTRRTNVLAFDPKTGSVAEHLKGAHPYTLIQPNPKHGYFWGRSELEDLMEPQGWLSDTCFDTRRLFNLQIDKILGFTGEGIQDEEYDQMRAAGFFNLGAGGAVTDLTPKFPPEAFTMIDKIIGFIEQLGGFDNVLSGRGEPGVRSGNHAGMMKQTASPRLRDRSLLVERQCAVAADFWLRVCEAKDGRKYWTDGTNSETQEATGFLLDDIPDDRRVMVDSHSASPIFQDDHSQLVTWGLDKGVTDPDYVVDHLPFPDKETLHHSIKARAAARQKEIEGLKHSDPEAYAKLLEKSAGGGHHR